MFYIEIIFEFDYNIVDVKKLDKLVLDVEKYLVLILIDSGVYDKNLGKVYCKFLKLINLKRIFVKENNFIDKE